MKIEISKAEAQIISQLLDMAADEFGNHGCNDLSEEFFEGIDKEELVKISQEFFESDNAQGDWENPEDYRKFAMSNDSVLMDLFSKKLAEMSK